MFQLIDTHTHLDDPAFVDDIEQVVETSQAAGVTQWINVGYCPERWQTTLSLAARFKGMHYMVGMHPGHAEEWDEGTSRELESLLGKANPVAIGEIGIDLHWRQDNLAKQQEAFQRQLDLAVHFDLPAVIHMRDANLEVLEVLSGTRELPHIHFHSFDGNDQLRRYVVENACTIGIGGLMTRKPSESLRTWLVDISRHLAVLETDAPYLKPQGIRGRRNEPAFITRTAERLAELWETTPEDVATVTTANAMRIFRLRGNG